MSAETGAKLEVHLTCPVVLVGLMGAGKTSVGKRLASIIGAEFFDSDHEIELAAGLKVSEIFERFGEKYFREGETRVISRLLQQKSAIIATGGGAFMSPEIRQNIAVKGISVWIRADLDLLWGRVRDKPSRPLLARPNARQVLADLIEIRYPVYAKATVTVDSEKSVTHERMAQKILMAVRQHDLDHAENGPCLVRGENSGN